MIGWMIGWLGCGRPAGWELRPALPCAKCDTEEGAGGAGIPAEQRIFYSTLVPSPAYLDCIIQAANGTLAALYGIDRVPHGATSEDYHSLLDGIPIVMKPILGRSAGFWHHWMVMMMSRGWRWRQTVTQRTTMLMAGVVARQTIVMTATSGCTIWRWHWDCCMMGMHHPQSLIWTCHWHCWGMHHPLQQSLIQHRHHPLQQGLIQHRHHLQQSLPEGGGVVEVAEAAEVGEEGICQQGPASRARHGVASGWLKNPTVPGRPHAHSTRAQPQPRDARSHWRFFAMGVARRPS